MSGVLQPVLQFGIAGRCGDTVYAKTTVYDLIIFALKCITPTNQTTVIF